MPKLITAPPSASSERRFYDEHYDAALWEGNIGRAIALVHRRMERGINERFDRVLEVGAGAGQHRGYVNHPYDTYVETDLRVLGSTSKRESDGRNVIREFADATALAYPDASFDRLIATCLLMHLPEPELALSEWRRVVRPGGLLSIYVPCEPGLATRLTRRLTTARKVKKMGVESYDLFVAREHRNHFAALDVLLRHEFRDDDLRAKFWPLAAPSWNLNYFANYRVRRI